MKNLLLCAYPSDEISLFGNVVLADPAAEWSAVIACADPGVGQSRSEAEEAWRQCCCALGIGPRETLGLPLLSGEQYSASDLITILAPPLSGFDRVYVANIEDEDGLRRAMTTAAALLGAQCWMVADTGVGDVCALDQFRMARLFEVANRYYADRLRVGRLTVQNLKGVRQYRQMRAADLERFAKEFLSWHSLSVKGDDPWDLESSAYEHDRYQLELSILRQLSWQSMIEVGAGVGTFTAMAAATFSENHITAYEPNIDFHRRLSLRLGDRVETKLGGIQDVKGSCDLLFISSVLYYLDRFPLNVLTIPRKWLVLSHLRSFHDQRVSPALHSAGWECAHRKELPPRIEMFCEIPVLKDGTEVVVWQRT